MGYIKQLDSIRAIAVILVIIWHWFPRNGFIENLHPGSLGVNMFFVLSGFLITEILLQQRNRTDDSIKERKNVLKNFYVRRVLRIFPIYYLTIVLSVVLNSWLKLGITKNEILSNITYTNNFFVYLTKSWPLSSLHFWSLAVEEQFYLAWPLIMLFWPKKYLVPSIIAFIVTGFLSQLFIADSQFGYLPTNTCLDCFGIGGLLAYIVVYRGQYLQKFYKLLGILGIVGIFLLAISWTLNIYIRNTRFIHAILSAWLISHILIHKQKKSAVVSFLSNWLLISIGKVSYGIYLYHILYVYVANKLWYKYVFDYYYPFIDIKFEPWIFTIVHFALLYCLCLFSWRFIEKPFLNLKQKFQYG